MERIGRMGDGGKWVCGMSLYEAIPPQRPCIIYSFGVQFESSFGELRDLGHPNNYQSANDSFDRR
jgi:Methyltransferase domain